MNDTQPRWLLVLAPDGTVIATSGGAPHAWVGEPLDAVLAAHAGARAAAAALRARLCDPARGTMAERAEVAPEGEVPALELVAVEAIGLRRAPVDLGSLLTSALEPMKRQADVLEIRLDIQCDAALPGQIALDPEKIAWAVTTLVGNALRHVRRGTRSRPGGTIRVEAVHDAEAEQVAIAVTDDGPGIPEAQRPWLFARKPGMAHAVGLGLKLVHDVVTAHGGSAEVTSTTDGPDHGTTITLRLPAR